MKAFILTSLDVSILSCYHPYLTCNFLSLAKEWRHLLIPLMYLLVVITAPSMKGTYVIVTLTLCIPLHLSHTILPIPFFSIPISTHVFIFFFYTLQVIWIESSLIEYRISFISKNLLDVAKFINFDFLKQLSIKLLMKLTTNTLFNVIFQVVVK